MLRTRTRTLRKRRKPLRPLLIIPKEKVTSKFKRKKKSATKPSKSVAKKKVKKIPLRNKLIEISEKQKRKLKSRLKRKKKKKVHTFPSLKVANPQAIRPFKLTRKPGIRKKLRRNSRIEKKVYPKGLSAPLFDYFWKIRILRFAARTKQLRHVGSFNKFLRISSYHALSMKRFLVSQHKLKPFKGRFNERVRGAFRRLRLSRAHIIQNFHLKLQWFHALGRWQARRDGCEFPKNAVSLSIKNLSSFIKLKCWTFEQRKYLEFLRNKRQLLAQHRKLLRNQKKAALVQTSPQATLTNFNVSANSEKNNYWIETKAPEMKEEQPVKPKRKYVRKNKPVEIAST